MPSGARQVDWSVENQKKFLEAAIHFGCLKLDHDGAANIAKFIGCPEQCLRTFIDKRKAAFKKNNAAYLSGHPTAPTTGPTMARKRSAPGSSKKTAKPRKSTKTSKNGKKSVVDESEEEEEFVGDDEDEEEEIETGLQSPSSTPVKRESPRSKSKVDYGFLNGMDGQGELQSVMDNEEDEIEGGDGSYDPHAE